MEETASLTYSRQARLTSSLQRRRGEENREPAENRLIEPSTVAAVMAVEIARTTSHEARAFTLLNDRLAVRRDVSRHSFDRMRRERVTAHARGSRLV